VFQGHPSGDRTAREISEEIEGIGGIMNAGTTIKELTVYWAKVGDHRFAATLVDISPTA